MVRRPGRLNHDIMRGSDCEIISIKKEIWSGPEGFSQRSTDQEETCSFTERAWSTAVTAASVTAFKTTNLRTRISLTVAGYPRIAIAASTAVIRIQNPGHLGESPCGYARRRVRCLPSCREPHTFRPPHTLITSAISSTSQGTLSLPDCPCTNRNPPTY